MGIIFTVNIYVVFDYLKQSQTDRSCLLYDQAHQLNHYDIDIQYTHTHTHTHIYKLMPVAYGIERSLLNLA